MPLLHLIDVDFEEDSEPWDEVAEVEAVDDDECASWEEDDDLAEVI